MQMTELNPVEDYRYYTYPDGQSIRIPGPITHIAVSKQSGNHRLQTRGGIHIVAPGWRHIAIGSQQFTF